MTDTAYTILDKHNTLGFYLNSDAGMEIFTPVITTTRAITNADTPSGNVLPFATTAGINTLGDKVFGLHIPTNTTVTGATSTTITLSNSITGDVPTNTLITFAHETDEFVETPSNASIEGLLHTDGITPLHSTSITFTTASGNIMIGSILGGSGGLAFNTAVLSVGGTTITIDKPTTGSIPDNTAITFVNPYPLTSRSVDAKASGAYYVEFVTDKIGLGSPNGVGFGVAQFGASIWGLANSASLAALYYVGTHEVMVNGVVKVTVPPIMANLTANVLIGDIVLPIGGLFGQTEGDDVSGLHVVGGSYIVAIDTSPLSATFGAITLNQPVAANIPIGTPITITPALHDGNILCAAIDISGQTIAFRKIGGAGGVVGAWSSNADISSLEIDGGLLLAVVNGTGNGGVSFTLSSAPTNFAGGNPQDGARNPTIPGGFTPGWSITKFSDALGVAKLIAFTKSSPPNLALRKITQQILSSPPSLAVRKAIAAILSGPPGLAVRKLTAILFLTPAPNPPWYPMSHPPIFPALKGLTYNVVKRPIWSTGKSRAGSGRTIRVGYFQVNLWEFELTYTYLPDGQLNGTSPNDLKALEGFFLQPSVSGGLGGFLFDDPDDDYVLGELQGTTDGTSTDWIIGRKFSHAGGALQVDSVFEPVGWVNTGVTLNVYLDGVLQNPSTYDIVTNTPLQSKVHFHSPPTTDQAIAVDFGYWFYVTFQDDKLDFTKFMNKLWQQDKIVLESQRG